jgi:HSP20 family molecular chaperone IbpA
MSGNDWEETILKQMVEMFKQMGINIDRDQMDQMLRQVREQFEDIGIDLDNLPEDAIRIDAKQNLEEMAKALGNIMKGGGDPSELFENLGVKLEVDAKPITVETPSEEADEEGGIRPEELDIFVDDTRIEVIVDLSRHEGIAESSLELTLINGDTLHLLKANQIRPFASIQLPEAVEKLDSWSLNNGILDIRLEKA